MSPAETQRRRRIARKAAQQALRTLGQPIPVVAPSWGTAAAGAYPVEESDNMYHVYVQRVENGGFSLDMNGKRWFAKDHDDLKEVFIEALVRQSVSRAL